MKQRVTKSKTKDKWNITLVTVIGDYGIIRRYRETQTKPYYSIGYRTESLRPGAANKYATVETRDTLPEAKARARELAGIRKQRLSVAKKMKRKTK